MKYPRKPLMLGAALVVLIMMVAVTRVRAVQDWYHSVTVQGRVTMWLLDDHARVDGVLLDEGSQIRVSPQLAEALLSHARVGDTISVAGRGGRRSSFGRIVHARTLTANGQTLIAVDEPHPGPRHGPPAPGGPHPPGPGEEPFPPPPPPQHDGGRGHIPPPPPGSAAANGPLTPPSRPGPADAPPPPPPSGAAADPGTANPPVPPAAAPASGAPDAPPPPPSPDAHPITARGKVQAFLVGERGEVVGLALDTGEQVHVAPRVGEGLLSGSTAPHPDVVLEGDAVRSERGTVVRARQITIGAQTWIVQ